MTEHKKYIPWTHFNLFAFNLFVHSADEWETEWNTEDEWNTEEPRQKYLLLFHTSDHVEETAVV